MLAPSATLFQSGEYVFVCSEVAELPGVIICEIAPDLYMVEVEDDCPKHLVSSRELRHDPTNGEKRRGQKRTGVPTLI